MLEHQAGGEAVFYVQIRSNKLLQESIPLNASSELPVQARQ